MMMMKMMMVELPLHRNFCTYIFFAGYIINYIFYFVLFYLIYYMIHTTYLMKNKDWTHSKIKELKISKSDLEKFKNSVGNETSHSNLETVEKH